MHFKHTSSFLGGLTPLSADDLDWQRRSPTAAQREVLRSDAERLQFSRGLRRKFFDSRMFGEPAWDIMLTLYASHHRERRLIFSRLAAAADVPQTTALRWLTFLEERGLINRIASPVDQRIIHVELTTLGSQMIESYLMQMREAEVFGHPPA